MTAILLVIWALFANNPTDLGDPWSGWFIGLFITSILDLLSRSVTTPDK